MRRKLPAELLALLLTVPVLQTDVFAVDGSAKPTSILSVGIAVLGWLLLLALFFVWKQQKLISIAGQTQKKTKGIRVWKPRFAPVSNASEADGNVASVNRTAAWIPAVLAVIYFFIPFAVHWGHIAAGDSLVSGDGTGLLYDLEYLYKSLSVMDIPLWTPYLMGGMPYAATHSLLLNPITWLCSIIPEVYRLPFFFGVYCAIGGTGMYLYLKRLGCRSIVAVSVSALYLFTVHMGGARKEHNWLIATALLVPAILFFLETYLQRRQAKWLLCASLIMALQFFGGFLQYIIYSDILCFFYLLFFGIHRKFPIKTMLLHGLLWVGAYFGLIMASVIPLGELMIGLQGDGEAATYQTFSSYSLHPLKLAMSVFPELFGEDVWARLLEVGNYSSGMDAELSLGAPAMAMLLSGVLLFRKNSHARFMTMACCAALVYACLSNIPVLGKVLYHIPILNMFRVPSRTLWISTLAGVSLIALALQELCDSPDFVSKIRAVNKGLLLAMALVTLCYYNAGELVLPMVERRSFQTVFLLPYLLFAIYWAAFEICTRLIARERLPRGAVRGISLLVLLLAVIQMFPYYKYSNYKNDSLLYQYPVELSDIDMHKVWSANAGDIPLAINLSEAEEIPSLNAYTNFNLPNLYKYQMHTPSVPMNHSGLYEQECQNTIHLLREDNQLLSMLGVKYILLSSQTDHSQIEAIADYSVDAVLIEDGEEELFQADGYQYAIWPVQLEKDCYYRIFLKTESDAEGAQFYVDFSDVGYDDPAQEQWFTMQSGVNTYEAILPSDDPTGSGNTLFRVIALTDAEIKLSDIIVAKITPMYTSNYRLVAEYSGYYLVENLNAEQMIYAPDAVVMMEADQIQRLYIDPHDYNIQRTSYIAGQDVSVFYNPEDVRISSLELRNNRVSAVVSAPVDAFVNMSQNYYPGWHAYVDGKKTEVYEVNGIIQGAFIPAGTHRVEFRFEPGSCYAGLAISAATLAVCCIVILRKRKRSA